MNTPNPDFIVIWDEDALQSSQAFMQDGCGLLAVFAVADALAFQPRPAHSYPYGNPDHRRLRAGQYRLMYEIDPPRGIITITHLGRVPPA